MQKFYDIPTQVRFKYKDDPHWEAGIAYHEDFICACCGGVTPLEELAEEEDEIVWVELPWARLAEPEMTYVIKFNNANNCWECFYLGKVIGAWHTEEGYDPELTPVCALLDGLGYDPTTIDGLWEE